MNTYEFDIWYQVTHNGKFSHTVIRTHLVHALKEERARKKVTLQKGKTWGEIGIEIVSGDEFIYRVRKTGTVKKQMYYVYSDGRNPRPVKGERYENNRNPNVREPSPAHPRRNQDPD